MIHPLAINIEAANLREVVNTRGLAADGTGNHDQEERLPYLVVYVGVVVAFRVREVTGLLPDVIQAQKLVEGGAWKIDSSESTTLVQEAMVDSDSVDIKSVGLVQIVDPDDLCLRRSRKVLGGKDAQLSEHESLVDSRTVIAGDETSLAGCGKTYFFMKNLSEPCDKADFLPFLIRTSRTR